MTVMNEINAHEWLDCFKHSYELTDEKKSSFRKIMHNLWSDVNGFYEEGEPDEEGAIPIKIIPNDLYFSSETYKEVERLLDGN